MNLRTTHDGALPCLGIDPAEVAGTAWERGTQQRDTLERESYDLAAVADLLGVRPSSVRRRLVAKELLGFHRRGDDRWFLPRFQFDLGLHTNADWATLLGALPDFDGCAPVVLVDWLLSPHQHLGNRSRAEVVATEGLVPALLDEAACYGIVA